MDGRDVDPSFPHRLRPPFRHPPFLRDVNGHRPKLVGKDLPDAFRPHDDDDEDEYDDEDEEDEEDDDEEEDDEEDEDEDEIDDDDGEEEETVDLRHADLLRRDRNPHPSFPVKQGVQKDPSNPFGASAALSLSRADAALSLSRADAARALLKAGEQEKHHRDDWNETATLALLKVWGAKFLELGRRSLKLEDWSEVAEQVARLAKTFKTDIQCRNRIDTLKKKYKREKHKQAAIGSSDTKWAYYKQMDALLNTVPKRTGLPGAVDAGQIVRTNPRLWKNGKPELDAPTNANFASTSCDQRDSSEMSQSSPNMSGDENEGYQNSRKRKSNEAPFRSLAKAIKRFGEIYEKMENAKQQQLLDLEKTRMKFTRDLELHKMQLLMQTQVELAKMKQGSNDMDASVSNMSG